MPFQTHHPTPFNAPVCNYLATLQITLTDFKDLITDSTQFLVIIRFDVRNLISIKIVLHQIQKLVAATAQVVPSVLLISLRYPKLSALIYELIDSCLFKTAHQSTFTLQAI